MSVNNKIKQNMNADNNNFKELIQVMNERQRVLKNAFVEEQDETRAIMIKQDLNQCVRYTNYYKDYLAHDMSPKVTHIINKLLEIEKEALKQDKMYEYRR
jgi:DNA-directed RNA polymerase